MMLHRNAKLGLAGRLALVQAIEAGMSMKAAAAAFSVSPATAHRWSHRWREAGAEARQTLSCLCDRSSRPHRSPRELAGELQERICACRQRTGWGPRLVAAATGFAHSTVWKVLRRAGLARRPPPIREPANSYEWPCPGDLLHMDVSRFARFERPGHAVTGDRSQRSRNWMRSETRVGYDYAHAIVDDHSRLSFVELHGDERAETVTGFLERALAFYASHGVEAKRLMTPSATSGTARCASCSRRVASATSPPSPTGRGRTGRSSASTKRSRASGRTASPTAHTASATRRCHTGLSTTTGADRTARSETDHRSAAFTTSVGRTARYRGSS
jgi:transposase